MFWIEAPGLRPGRLGTAARPRAGDWLDGEIENWRSASVDMVVSLLEPHEVHDLKLNSERDICMQMGLTYLSFPVPDRGVPESLSRTRDLIALCTEQLVAGAGIIVHCRAGIGRSSMIAACVLVAVGNRPDTALEYIKAARGLPLPDTPAQAEWVMSFTAV